MEDGARGTKAVSPGIILISSIRLYVPAALPVPGRAEVVLDQGGGAGNERRKIRAVSPLLGSLRCRVLGGRKTHMGKRHVLIACVCSLAPGLIAAGISAALSDDKWLAATYATLLTYGGLFGLFLTWRLIATPWELDRERQRFIDGLTQKLAYTRLELVALRASPPAIDVEILEIHVQAADTTHSMHASDLPVACDIFLRVKLTLRDTRPIGLLAYELASVLHGNSSRADFVDDIQDWGLVTEKKPIGAGTTFHYTVVRLTKLAQELEERGVPVEGWIHFSVTGVHEREIGATIYRLNVLTPNGGISADIAGTKNLARLAGRQV